MWPVRFGDRWNVEVEPCLMCQIMTAMPSHDTVWFIDGGEVPVSFSCHSILFDSSPEKH